MKVTKLCLHDLLLIEPDCFFDERGFFLESFRESRYREIGISCSFVQDNHSFSHKNVLRGMHFQEGGSQAKLVSVLVGTIYDVAVDIRTSSKTFGKWAGALLDGQSHRQLFIPEGFAHGFCALSDFAHVTYKVSRPFSAEKERSFRFDDPDLAIEWPVSSFILSKKDREAPFFKELFSLEAR
jgi:dTDP-4-dehydrorhamnose 3,5-epimerase